MPPEAMTPRRGRSDRHDSQNQRPWPGLPLFLSAALAAGCALAAATLVRAQSDLPPWDQRPSKNFTEPAWLDQGIVFVGNWEPLDFRRRTNGQGLRELPEDLEERYAAEHTPETVRKLKEAGVNLVVTHFFKMGLETDHDDIAVARRFIALCHQEGLKVGAYVGGTLFTEALLREDPEAKNWVLRDDTGFPLHYSTVSYRYVPDFHHPGYIAYIKGVLRDAIVDSGADMIHFDNRDQPPPPLTGFTPEVNRRFRAFLHRKYSADQLKRRYGFSNIDAVTVPTWHQNPNPTAISPITDPLIEDWIDFRCQDHADAYGELADYIRQLNPNEVVELNPAGISGSNRAFLNGIDHARLLPHGSVFWTEEQDTAGVDPNGVLVSKIRSYKLATSLEETLFTYTGPIEPNYGAHLPYRRLMAEAMSFNRNCLGDLGEPLNVNGWPQDLLRYVRFYHQQNGHYQKMHPVADVALLRSFPSLAYDSLDPQLETTLMEQLLIQYKVPFRYVFDQDLADLSRYRVLVLPDQEALSDLEIRQISDYVRRGGNLVVTGRTSAYTASHRRRADLGLAPVLGVHASDLPVFARGSYGRGRVAYVREVVPAIPIPGWNQPGTADNVKAQNGIKNTYWKLPANSSALVSALRYALGAPFSVEFEDAPLTTVMELNDKADGSERVLHWVNFRTGTTVPSTAVTVAVPEGRSVSGVEWLSPDSASDAAVPLDYALDAGRVRFTAPSLDVYGVAVISLK